MKWYKKQMDKLKAQNPDLPDTDKEVVKNTWGHNFDPKKTAITKRAFPSPVAASKLKRPKTDAK